MRYLPEVNHLRTFSGIVCPIDGGLAEVVLTGCYLNFQALTLYPTPWRSTLRWLCQSWLAQQLLKAQVFLVVDMWSRNGVRILDIPRTDLAASRR